MRTHASPLRRVLPAATAALLLAPLVAASPARADDRRTIVHVPAVSAARVDGRAVADDDRVEAEIVLDLRDPQGAADLATAVSTPGSADRGRFLAPADWIARFSPAQADVDAVTAAATDAGLTVESVPDSRLFVVVAGDAAAVEAFFATDLRVRALHGVATVVPARDVSLPASAARGVRTISFGRPPVRSAAVRPAASGSRTVPCSHWYGQHRVRTPKAYGARSAATALCGYSAAQVRALYGFGSASSGLDGTGQTIAVIDAFGSPTMRSDLARWSARSGLPAADYAEQVPVASTWRTSSSCAPDGWAGEQSLDLEAAHAVAPRARLLYVGTTDCGFGFDVALSRVLDQGLASIVSNSYGSTGLDTFASDFGGAATILLNTNQHLQAAAQGVGLYFASGDDGDDSAYFGRPAVDFPASSPWVTAVGGTAAALDRRNRTVFRTAWGDRVVTATRSGKTWQQRLPGALVGGAGGGVSALFQAPAYQAGLGHGMRTSTDVSALASPFTGFATGRTSSGRWRTETVGGTSLATPIVAAQAAIAQQRAGHVLGFLNPALYRAAGLRDVVRSRTTRTLATTSRGRLALVTLDRDTSLTARPGYDLPTGLGELTPTALLSLGRR